MGAGGFFLLWGSSYTPHSLPEVTWLIKGLCGLHLSHRGGVLVFVIDGARDTVDMGKVEAVIAAYVCSQCFVERSVFLLVDVPVQLP